MCKTPPSMPFCLVVSLMVFCVMSPCIDTVALARDARAIVHSPEFQSNFQDFQQKTSFYAIPELNGHLEREIRSVFLNTSNVGRNSLKPVVGIFLNVMLEGIQSALCHGGPQAMPSEADRKIIIVNAIDRAAYESSVNPSDRSFGKITGIVVNIFDQTTTREICQQSSFSDLR